MIHATLTKERVDPRREFFLIEKSRAIEVCQELLSSNNLLDVDETSHSANVRSSETSAAVL